MTEHNFTYAQAGVDIDNADATKRDMQKSLAASDRRLLSKPGAFAALFEASFEGIEHPVLVLKAEEPGSKQLLAFKYNKIRNICYDLINHLVNDIIVMGAKPEVVLDIILCGKIDKEIVVKIVEGIADACKEQGCHLIGGETSEQPKVLDNGTFMLNASIVGVVDKHAIIDGSRIRVGDQVIALPSNGLHTNGYTLIRALMESYPGIADERIDGESFVDAILKPHLCYYPVLRPLFPGGKIRGLAHITGGGIQGNLNRILPEGTSARIDLHTIEVLPLFKLIRQYARLDDEEMLRTFNMGVGLAMVCSPEDAPILLERLSDLGSSAYVIGEIVPGNQTVAFTNELR